MKRVLALSLIFILIIGTGLSGCGDKQPEKEPSQNTANIQKENGASKAEADNGLVEEAGINGSNGNTETESGEKTETEQGTNQSANENKDTPGGHTTNSGSNNQNKEPDGAVKSTDTMKWPVNEYTNAIPRPTNGVVKETGTQNGIFSLLLTGTDQGYAKGYAAMLLNAGFTEGVTESNDESSYTFGGGNSAGVFVVVSYDQGRFMIGIQK